jgi:hypothetical protein
LAKNQSTQRCQSLITQGSDHPLVLEPHMVLTKFLLYSSSIFDIVMINDKSTHLFIELLVFYEHMLGSRKYVSMVLRYNLLADSPYTLGRVVDRGCDRTIESFVVHPPSISLVEQWFLGGVKFHPRFSWVIFGVFTFFHDYAISDDMLH